MNLHFPALLLSLLPLAAAEFPKAPPLLPPDTRYKADLLLIVAHPDDDVVIGGYLARASLDEHKRIAVIYCTTGEGGGNSVGFEAGRSLGEMRTIEARRALGSLGIENVWFLDGHDTPGQDVLWSLDNWNHGGALDRIVRLVRLTRPEVILTWLPDYVVGENHDDHQGAGVLATEAFDAAGDPTRFPEQVAPPRNRQGMMNMTEGLHPWQPQKIYYFTDAFEDFGPYWHDVQERSPFRKNIAEDAGPTYSQTDISPLRKTSYAKLTAEYQTFYLTQEGYLGTGAIKKNDFQDFEYPTRFIFGKSVVGGSTTGDIFENVRPDDACAFAPVTGYRASKTDELTFELGEPWAFYRAFWKAHGIEHISSLLPVPEAAIRFGNTLHIPLTIRNGTTAARDVTLTFQLPAGWSNKTRFAVYPVRAGGAYPVQAEIAGPQTGERGWQQLTFQGEVDGRRIGTVELRVYVSNSGALPQ